MGIFATLISLTLKNLTLLVYINGIGMFEVFINCIGLFSPQKTSWSSVHLKPNYIAILHIHA